MNGAEIVRSYFERNYRVVFWPERGAQKGPTEEGWKTKVYRPEDFTPQTRVGIVTGQEIEPGKFLHDVDIDWAAGYHIAVAFLPRTEFVYGRASKPVSHCFYTLPEPLPRITFLDPIDKQTLIEIRGTKENGELGWQSMVPPSVWSNEEGQREKLEFRPSGVIGSPLFFENTDHFKRKVALSATGMLLAKRFGLNGFGHEVRLAWSGFSIIGLSPG